MGPSTAFRKIARNYDVKESDSISEVERKQENQSGTNNSSNMRSWFDEKNIGFKLWPNGLIVSSGHRELDSYFGGGFLLGTLALQIDDNISDYAHTLLRYHIAESISMDHVTLVMTSSLSEGSLIMERLPYNLNMGEIINENAEKKPQSKPTSSQQSNESEEHKLSIAWQYEKYLQPGTIFDI